MTRYTKYKKTFNRSMRDGGDKSAPHPYRSYGNSAPQKVCLKCRQPGHSIKDCPNGAEVQKCYNCGSEEHGLRECTLPDTGFKYATCYVCKKTGHLASQCPENDKGIYPDGGCCRFCGSIRHLARNCNPTTQDTNAVMVSAYNEGEDVRKVNPEDDFVFETLQKIQTEKIQKKIEKKLSGKKPKSSAKVVKF